MTMAAEFKAGTGRLFGSCCEEMNNILTADDFEPLLYVGDEDVLFMSVGVLDGDEDDESEGGFLDHPVYHCPFCGTKLQTPEEVDAKVGTDDDDEA